MKKTNKKKKTIILINNLLESRNIKKEKEQIHKMKLRNYFHLLFLHLIHNNLNRTHLFLFNLYCMLLFLHNILRMNLKENSNCLLNQ